MISFHSRPRVRRPGLGRFLVIALSLGGTGCAGHPLSSAPAAVPASLPVPAVPRTSAITLSHDDPRVGTFVSTEAGFTTSSYWIEGPSGLILIDTQFLLSSAAEFVNWAERTTGKKAVLAIVLHPNPDKFNGAEILKRRGIRVVTSDQVRRLIPDVHKDRHYWFYDRYKPDYPDLAPELESFGSATTELQAAGLMVRARVLGPGCSEAHVVVEFDGHVFVGDLVANLHHSWLELGRTDEWLLRLAEIRALRPRYVHPGRGPNGGPELLERETAYLSRVIELVKHSRHAHAGLASDDDAAEPILAALKAQLEIEHPGYGNAYFLELGLPAEWDRQARSRH